MRASIILIGIVFLAAVLLSGVGCERKVVTETQTVPVGAATYVGSEACAPAECHGSIYETFSVSGHPYKLNKAEDVQAGNYYPDFVPDLQGPPPGVSWDTVSYVIGGYWWKARFIGNSGYIITGDAVQYNHATQEWVGYHSGEIKPYACGPCHMTAYSYTGNQDGREGMIGTWALDGIQCEECHGPGSQHIGNPENINMMVDYSSELCGKCHIRGDVGTIPASGGFIRHHEQWNEMARTKHRGINCVDCHDPHVGLHPNNPDRINAIKLSCSDCHFEEYKSFVGSGLEHDANGVDCIDCHMPYTGKSAVGNLAEFTGDIRSHLMRINTDSTAELIGPDGANGYLTLDFTCLTPACHLGETKVWAADNAHDIHPISSPGKAGTAFSRLRLRSAHKID